MILTTQKSALCFLFLTYAQLLFGQEETTYTYYRTMPFTHSPTSCLERNDTSRIRRFSGIYQFEKQGEQIQSVTYRLNGRLKPLYENYSCSDFIWASQNLFSYRDNEIIIRHLDYQSKPIENKPAISRYTLDGQGRVIGLSYHTIDNETAEFRGIHRYEWKYLKREIGEIRYSQNGEIARMNNWFPYEWVLLTYNEEKDLTAIQTTAERWKKGKDATHVGFEIENSEIIRWVTTKNSGKDKSDNNGPQVAEARHDFNSFGYLIRTRFYDENGDRVKARWGHMGFIRSYNYQGNRLSYSFINSEDSVVLSPDRGYCGQQFNWSSNGLFRLATHYADLNGDPIFRESAGYAQLQFLYDHEGDEIGRVYKDADGNVVCTDVIRSYVLIKSESGRSRHTLCQ